MKCRDGIGVQFVEGGVEKISTVPREAASVWRRMGSVLGGSMDDPVKWFLHSLDWGHLVGSCLAVLFLTL